MVRMSCIAIGATALVAGAVFGITSCRAEDEAGRAARAASACERLCRLVVRSPDASPSGLCHRGCLAQLHVMGSTCERDWLQWVECEICSTQKGARIPAKTADFAESVRASCASEVATVRKCADDCRQAGILHSGAIEAGDAGAMTRTTTYEVRFQGCSACVHEIGAGAEAPCSAAKVCSSSCYGCRSGRSSIGLRACVDGHCASAEELEDLASRLEVLRPCLGGFAAH